MQASNSARAYGWVARLFHWSIALLILAAIGLGLYAGSLPRGSQEALQAIFETFSIHKTVGVAVLILAVLRILWTLTQSHPRPLHPNRALENFLAGVVHWGMWAGMVIMPLSGWLLHSAAPGGFRASSGRWASACRWSPRTRHWQNALLPSMRPAGGCSPGWWGCMSRAR